MIHNELFFFWFDLGILRFREKIQKYFFSFLVQMKSLRFASKIYRPWIRNYLNDLMSKVNSLEGDSDRIRHWDTTGTAVWVWFLLFSRKPCSLRVIEWLICILEGETVIFEQKITNPKPWKIVWPNMSFSNWSKQFFSLGLFLIKPFFTVLGTKISLCYWHLFVIISILQTWKSFFKHQFQ